MRQPNDQRNDKHRHREHFPGLPLEIPALYALALVVTIAIVGCHLIRLAYTAIAKFFAQ